MGLGVSAAVRIRHGPLLLSLDPRGMRFDLAHAGLPVFTGARLFLEPGGPLVPEAVCDAGGGGVRVVWGGPLALELEIGPRGDGVVLQGRVTCRAGSVWQGEGAVLLGLGASSGAVFGGASPASLRMLRNGWQSWSLACHIEPGLRVPRPRIDLLARMSEDPAGCGFPRGEGHHASWVTFLSQPVSRRAVVIGYLSGRHAFAGIDVGPHRGGLAVTARERLEGATLRPGESRTLAPLYLAAGDALSDLLTGFAEAVSREAGHRPAGEPPVGWCSWYRYFNRISEEKIAANVRALEGAREDLPVSTIQVDDGWQDRVGDWGENRRAFPSGLAALASGIVRRGFVPGLWLAPFVCVRGSRVFHRHRDWLLRDPATGLPRVAGWAPQWDRWRPFYALDPTHPGALAHVEGIVRRVSLQWGFRFLKLDFLYAAALPGVRYDRRATSAEAYVRGLGAIRNATEGAFILGCGAPLAPSVGLVDAMRVGPDVMPWWRSRLGERMTGGGNGMGVYHGIRNTLARWFLNGRVWWNDPDCLLARETRTRLVGSEVRAFAAAAVVAGGIRSFSDAVHELSPARRDLVGRFLRARLAHASPLDADTLPAPRFFRCDGDGVGWLGALNPEDVPVAWPRGGIAEEEGVEYWDPGRAPVRMPRPGSRIAARSGRLFRLGV